MPSRYNREHLDTFRLVRRYLAGLSQGEGSRLHERVRPYSDFRREVR